MKSSRKPCGWHFVQVYFVQSHSDFFLWYLVWWHFVQWHFVRWNFFKVHFVQWQFVQWHSFRYRSIETLFSSLYTQTNKILGTLSRRNSHLQKVRFHMAYRLVTFCLLTFWSATFCLVIFCPGFITSPDATTFFCRWWLQALGGVQTDKRQYSSINKRASNTDRFPCPISMYSALLT